MSLISMQEPVLFPSLVWFEALAQVAVGNEDRYRRLGVAEMSIGLRIGDEGYRVVFEDYDVSETALWDGSSPVDCVLSASPGDWRELIEHLRARGSADAAHTLNSLVLSGNRFVLSGEEQVGVDRFYRFNATLQAYLEGAREIPTRFA